LFRRRRFRSSSSSFSSSSSSTISLQSAIAINSPIGALSASRAIRVRAEPRDDAL
jgi:hypothetical protein